MKIKPEAKSAGFPATKSSAHSSGEGGRQPDNETNMCYRVLIVFYLVLTVYYHVLTVYYQVLTVYYLVLTVYYHVLTVYYLARNGL